MEIIQSEQEKKNKKSEDSFKGLMGHHQADKMS